MQGGAQIMQGGVQQSTQSAITYGAPSASVQYAQGGAQFMQGGGQVIQGGVQYMQQPAQSAVTYGAPAASVQYVQGGAQGMQGNIFDVVDRNHDGSISRAEFAQFM